MNDPPTGMNYRPADPIADIDANSAPPQRGWTVISWCIIMTAVLTILAMPREAEQADRAVSRRVQLSIIEMQGKYVVGAANVPVAAPREELYEQAKALNVGPLDNRLRFIAVTGELVGPDEAVTKLNELRELLGESPTEPEERQLAVLQTLEQLYQDYQQEQWDAPSVGASQRQQLQEQLGWFGQLALLPPETDDEQARSALLRPAQMTVFQVIAGVLLLLFIGLIAVAGTFVFLLLLASRSLQSALSPGSPNTGIYIEAFALWLVLHFLVGLLGSALAPRDMVLLVATGTFAVSGLATFWPWLRGVSWSQLCEDIGLTRGKNWIVEMLCGLAAYLSTMPVVVLVLLVTLGLLAAVSPAPEVPPDPLAPQPTPTHPAVEWLLEATMAQRLTVILLACVAAPLVEEVMFRGYLYRHLRDLTATWRTAGSVVCSVLVSSFIFAVIHPQGWIAVPALGTLSASFALMREWRGSLVAPITAHALNNGAVMLGLMFFLG